MVGLSISTQGKGVMLWTEKKRNSKIDRNGIQFFWKHVLHREWDWIEIRVIPHDDGLMDFWIGGLLVLRSEKIKES